MAIIHNNTDYRVEVNNLRDQDGVLIGSADVTMTLYEPNSNNEVSGVSWPITMTSDVFGYYYGTLPKTVDLKNKKVYTLQIVATAGGVTRTWEEPIYLGYFNS